jgi:hypothetical protein
MTKNSYQYQQSKQSNFSSPLSEISPSKRTHQRVEGAETPKKITSHKRCNDQTGNKLDIL